MLFGLPNMSDYLKNKRMSLHCFYASIEILQENDIIIISTKPINNTIQLLNVV